MWFAFCLHLLRNSIHVILFYVYLNNIGSIMFWRRKHVIMAFAEPKYMAILSGNFLGLLAAILTALLPQAVYSI